VIVKPAGGHAGMSSAMSGCQSLLGARVRIGGAVKQGLTGSDQT
jgi:hypothetical protein